MPHKVLNHDRRHSSYIVIDDKRLETLNKDTFQASILVVAVDLIKQKINVFHAVAGRNACGSKLFHLLSVDARLLCFCTSTEGICEGCRDHFCQFLPDKPVS